MRTRLSRYPVDIETLAYRTIREALINVRRHAGAGNVAISVSERRGELHATVCDDGRGFAGGRRRSRTSKSMGIATARERIRAHGGSFEVRRPWERAPLWSSRCRCLPDDVSEPPRLVGAAGCDPFDSSWGGV